ncbi:MAG: CsbD family protein [Acidimicrobiales bacterium]|nr:CsbD family protein [Acidimicrobiia bacterium]NNF56330.1 CsbD family protein [Acidimicrobiales bacterium]
MEHDQSNDHTETNDVIPDNADEAKGRAKEAIGTLTGDEELQSEGKRDQATGQVKETIDKIGDKAKELVDSAKAKFND